MPPPLPQYIMGYCFKYFTSKHLFHYYYSGFPKETPELKFRLVFFFFFSFSHSFNLVPRASFPLTSGRKTRALGATISGMRHRCRCAVSRITRIRLFPLFFHNGCSQSSRFPTAGQGERSSGNEIATVCNSLINTHARRFY